MKKPNVKNIIAIRNYRRWLLEAKGLNEKSVVKMERAIHLYRDFTEDEDFNRFNADRAINFKNFLKQKKYRGNAMAPNSYRTYLIHLRGFFTWLCTQSGYYSFVEVPEGDYQIMIVEPLGYASDGNPKTTTVVASETSIVDFNLTEVVVINQARSKGYWKHQFDVYVGNRGNAQESEQDLNDYITLVQEHYNLHYDIFTDLTTLEDWQAILSLKGNHPMADRAKQHLSALILNMVSNKIGQYTVVTDDGRDVGDVVQYVSELIIDGDDTNDELAKDLAESVNNQQTIATGIVPEGTIVFKQGLLSGEVLTYKLFDNYPNPFNPATTIKYQIPNAGFVTLNVYDVLGNEVATLVNERKEEGRYEITFDASTLSSGVYIYQLRVNEFVDTKKMILMK